jgi:hypothetical protein
MAPTVRAYRPDEPGPFVNSHPAESVVAVGVPFLRSDGRALRAGLEAAGKHVVGVLVADPCPDRQARIIQLLAGDDVPVIAPRDLERWIRIIDDAKRPRPRGCSAPSGRRDAVADRQRRSRVRGLRCGPL